MSTLDRCAIEGCRAPAALRIKNLGPPWPTDGLPVCMAHARSIREKAVAGAMADPEVRAMLGLPARAEEVADGAGE